MQRVRPPVKVGSAATFVLRLDKTEEKERMLEDALSDWVKKASDLHEKTGSKKMGGGEPPGLGDDQMIYRVYGLPFDKTDLGKSNEMEFRAQLHGSLARTSFDLLRVASHCKDHAFPQEAEWRLALPHLKTKAMKNTELVHRGSNHAIPYIAHNLFSNKLPLVRVKAGPLCESMEQINSPLMRYGYGVPVERSAIPIRPAASIRA